MSAASTTAASPARLTPRTTHCAPVRFPTRAQKHRQPAGIGSWVVCGRRGCTRVGVLTRARGGWSGPAGADGAVGALHLLPVGVGLPVDHLEVATQLGDELLAGHRTGHH